MTLPLSTLSLKRSSVATLKLRLLQCRLRVRERGAGRDVGDVDRGRPDRVVDRDRLLAGHVRPGRRRGAGHLPVRDGVAVLGLRFVGDLHRSDRLQDPPGVLGALPAHRLDGVVVRPGRDHHEDVLALDHPRPGGRLGAQHLAFGDRLVPLRTGLHVDAVPGVLEFADRVRLAGAVQDRDLRVPPGGVVPTRVADRRAHQQQQDHDDGRDPAPAALASGLALVRGGHHRRLRRGAGRRPTRRRRTGRAPARVLTGGRAGRIDGGVVPGDGRVDAGRGLSVRSPAAPVVGRRALVRAGGPPVAGTPRHRHHRQLQRRAQVGDLGEERAGIGRAAGRVAVRGSDHQLVDLGRDGVVLHP